MSKASKKNRMKNTQEKSKYRYAINHSQYSPDTTETSLNDSLRGSDEIYNQYNRNEHEAKSVPMPGGIKFKKWLQDNRWEILICVILVGLLTWLSASVIELKVASAENEIKVEYLKERIASLDEAAVDKSLLNAELAAIEKDINNIDIFKIKGLESQITQLEKRIDELEKEIKNYEQLD